MAPNPLLKLRVLRADAASKLLLHKYNRRSSLSIQDIRKPIPFSTGGCLSQKDEINA